MNGKNEKKGAYRGPLFCLCFNPLREKGMGRRERRTRRPERERKGFILLFSIIAAMVLALILIKVGIPGISGSKEAGIRLSMLSDAKVAINAEHLCYVTDGGEYIPADLVNTSAPDSERDYLDKDQNTCPNVFIVASPGNHVHVDTYTSNSGKDCFIVTVTNKDLQDVEAYYNSCSTTASPEIIEKPSGAPSGPPVLPQ